MNSYNQSINHLLLFLLSPSPFFYINNKHISEEKGSIIPNNNNNNFSPFCSGPTSTLLYLWSSTIISTVRDSQRLPRCQGGFGVG